MTTDLTGGTYWLVALGSSADGLDNIKVMADGSIDLAGYTQIATGSVPGGTYGMADGVIGGLSSADNGSYYGIIVWDGDDNGFYGKSYGVVAGIVDDPPTDATPIVFDNSGLGYGATLATIQTEPIPEPTSGLMLLLGVAGLALRRKQK